MLSPKVVRPLSSRDKVLLQCEQTQPMHFEELLSPGSVMFLAHFLNITPVTQYNKKIYEATFTVAPRSTNKSQQQYALEKFSFKAAFHVMKVIWTTVLGNKSGIAEAVLSELSSSARLAIGSCDNTDSLILENWEK